jgi:1-acyl-sn-glycerol-3-phosphate acyltransferase
MSTALSGKISFVAGDFTLGIPGVSAICKAMECIFVPRGGSKSALEKTLHLIEERQQNIEDGEGFNPFIIFPEGTCSNNTCLRKFKRGAFSGLKSVCPVSIKYHWTTVSPSLDVIDEYINLPLLCMNTARIRCDIKIMPPF